MRTTGRARTGVILGSAATLAVLWLGTAACSSKDEAGPARRGAPPPTASSPGGAGSASATVTCASAVAPVLAPLPLKVDAYCLEGPDVDAAFGEGAKKPIGDVANLFDGGAEVYLRHKATRVVQVRYVDPSAPTRFVTVTLTRSDTKENAFGMFSQLLVGDRDPADPTLPKRKDGVARATFGTGNAYVFRGSSVAEIVYGDDQASPEVLKKEGGPVLEKMAKAIGDALDGDANFPESVAKLPADERLELGERYVVDALLGVPGVRGALGYYKRGDKRYRIAIVSNKAPEAESMIDTFVAKSCKAPKTCSFKKQPEGIAWFRTEESGVTIEWAVAMQGDRMVAVGDEARVMRADLPPDERAKMVLTSDDKSALATKLAGS